MRWFGRKQSESNKVAVEVANESKVEVIAHKRATKKVINRTKQVNELLNDLLVENGFTFKIFLASGGNQIRHKKGQ